MAGEGVTAERGGPECGVGPETDLYPPEFDADQVAAADGRGSSGVPPDVPSEPVLGVGVGIDQPDSSVVADGERFAIRVGPDLNFAGLWGGVGDGAHGVVVFFRGAVVRVGQAA